MATVGNLNVNVNARTARFMKKMKSVRGSVARFGRAIGGIAKKLALFSVMAGTVAVVAIIALTKKGLASVDALAKLAQSINSSVAALQTLQHMATIGGVSIEKMDKSISKMVKNVGEVTMGIGTATDAFKELGLDANKLQLMQPDKMFGTIADAINQIPTAAQRSSLAYDIFGRAGQELLVTMQGGSQAVDDMRQHLEELGVVIGDEQAQMVEKANDAWADIGLVWKGLQQQLAVNFAPLLEKIANKIIAMVKAFGGMGQVAEFIVKGVLYAGAFVLDVIHGVKLGFYGLRAAVLQVAADIVRGMAWAAEQIETAWNSIKGLHEQAIGWTDQVISAVAGANAAVAELVGWESMGKEMRFLQEGALIAAGDSRENAAKIYAQEINRNISDFLGSIGDSLGDQAADAAGTFLDTLDKGWSMGKVPETFRTLIDNALGEGFKDLEGDVTLTAPDVKGAAETLQTALGGFKVEGDQTARRQDQQIEIEKSQLIELKKISNNLSTAGTGGALT